MKTSLVWFYLFIGLTVLLFLLVPRDRILRLLLFGLIAGFGLAFILQYGAVNIFRWWKFNYALIEIYGAPLGVSLSWIPAVIIFAYFWPLAVSRLGQLIYLIFFAVGTTIVEYSFVIFGYREYINWNVLLTFCLAFIVHLLLAFYLYLTTAKKPMSTSR